ncbi:hypothetical protein ACNOYE_29690 [Nannocystaceae bacterium ST9]
MVGHDLDRRGVGPAQDRAGVADDHHVAARKRDGPEVFVARGLDRRPARARVGADQDRPGAPDRDHRLAVVVEAAQLAGALGHAGRLPGQARVGAVERDAVADDRGPALADRRREEIGGAAELDRRPTPGLVGDQGRAVGADHERALVGLVDAEQVGLGRDLDRVPLARLVDADHRAGRADGHAEAVLLVHREQIHAERPDSVVELGAGAHAVLNGEVTAGAQARDPEHGGEAARGQDSGEGRLVGGRHVLSLRAKSRSDRSRQNRPSNACKDTTAVSRSLVC